MYVDMKSFLISGVFGQISLPMSRQDIKAILGEPDDWTSEQSQSTASIWKYANVEFHFEPRTDAAWMIFSDDLASSISTSALLLESWIVRGQIPLEDAEAALLQAGIVYQRISNPVFETIDLIMTSKVKLSFSIIESTADVFALRSWSKQIQP